MSSLKSCVFSVVHQGCLDFFEDFLQSLNRQTNSDFDLFLVVDNVSLLILKGIAQKINYKFNISYLEHSGGLLENRVKGLRQLNKTNKDYQSIIFVDSDDLLSDNYVEVVTKYMKSFDFVFSDLVPFYNNDYEHSNKPIWLERFQKLDIIDISFLRDKNVLGFGNTSINFKLIKRLKFRYPEPIAPDWFFFKNLLTPFDKIKFIKGSFIFYRQHSANIAGYKTITPNKLKHIFRIKCDHYNLMEYNDTSLIQEIKVVQEILKSEQQINHSVKYLNQKKINFFWWEETTYLKKSKQ